MSKVVSLDSAWFDSHPNHTARMRPATDFELSARGVCRFSSHGCRTWAIVRRSDGAVTLIAMPGSWPNAPGDPDPDSYAMLPVCSLEQFFEDPGHVISMGGANAD